MSVIVPLYNKSRTVAATLRSICAQTWTDLEVIVVDDGSTDAGADEVAKFCDSRIRLVRQENAGPGAARNTGIGHARAPLLAFLDADDEWLPDFLGRAVPLLQRDPALAAVTFAWFHLPGRKSNVPKWRARGLRDGVLSVTADTDAALVVSASAFMSPCTTLARREILTRYGGFYTKGQCRYGEDAHLWMKLVFNHPVRFALEPAALIHYEASELSGNYTSMRPLEPFLTDPEDLRRSCPSALSAVLEEFLALRAMKTACVLAYWGRWREARGLLRQFHCARYGLRPQCWLSQAAATPLGALAGRVARSRASHR